MITLKNAQEIIKNEIDKLEFNNKPEELYKPIEYILKIGGKRIRPSLTLLACNLFTDEVLHAVYPALAIELFHNFTLIHDDIMDNANLRRGKKTIQFKWNNNIAILSGDAMCIKAYEILSKCDGKYLKEVMDVFSSTALRVCEGQQIDMNFETLQSVSEEEYLKMIELKTSVLFAASLKIGAITGGASPKDSELLYEFGKKLGLAFQLQDDLLDIFGNEFAFGKEIGKDVISNKKTYLLIKALELAKDIQLEVLKNWLDAKDFNPEEKVNSIREIYITLGIKEITRNVSEKYYSEALNSLKKVSVAEDKKKELISFLDSLRIRKY